MVAPHQRVYRVVDERARRPRGPGCAVVQNLAGFWEGVLVGRPHPSHRAGKPTVLRVHVAEEECRHRRQAALHSDELLCLGHANRLRDVAEVFTGNIEVRLHVRVENSERSMGAALPELDMEPALGHEEVDAGGL